MDRRNSSQPLRVVLWLAVLSFAVAGAGCGGGGGKKGKVSGTVKYRGTALPAGNVTFFNAKKEIVGNATIHNGSYTMESVPVGAVKVSVTTPPPVTADRSHPPPKDMPGGASTETVFIPADYGNPDKSRLTYDVKSGSQDFPIELQ